MKKLLAMVALLVLAPPNKLLACDVCAGGAGAGFTGLLPGMPQNYFGIRTGYQMFNHPNTPQNFNGNSRVKRDVFLRNELVYRQFLKPRLQLLVQVPYQIHTRIETEQSNSIQGVGDMQIGLLYQLLKRESKKFKHSVFVGGTAGLPTGTYQSRDANFVLLPERFQIGAGAFAGQARLLYFLRRGNYGVMADYSYRHFGTNEIDFQMGAQQVMGSQVFYIFERNGYTIVPSLGLQLEAFQRDVRFGNPKPDSGGRTVLTNVGIDLYLAKWLLQVVAQNRLWSGLPAAMPISGTRIGFMVARIF